MIYNMIVAYDKNKGIGKDNKLPWNIPEDLKKFSKLTKGSGNNAIIMGRHTWDSLPKKPLPNRDNIILSTQLELEESNPKNTLVKSFKSITEIMKFCEKQKYDIVWIIGGAKVYELFIIEGVLDYVYVTIIDNDYGCDVNFPAEFMACDLLDSYEENTNSGVKLKHKIYKPIKY